MHSLLISVWLLLLLLLLLLIFFVVKRIETATKIKRPNSCNASRSFHRDTISFFRYDLILFICHFIGALILIYTYFWGVLLTNCTRMKKKYSKFGSKSHTRYLCIYELNVQMCTLYKYIHVLYLARLSCCVVPCCFFSQFRIFILFFLSLDIHQAKKKHRKSL